MQQFEKVAQLYSKARPTYPYQVYKEILDWNGNVKYNTAIDLGCGSGQSIEGLQQISDLIIGVEPGDELRNSAEKKYPQYEFVKGTGEQTTLPSGIADLVTIATAFYWMDRTVALEEINRRLNPNGSLVLYRYMFPVVCSDANEVLTEHCKLYWDQFRDARLIREDDSAILIENSKHFQNVKSLKVNNIWKLSVNDFVQFLCSTSYVSKYLELIKQDSESYIKNLTQELFELNKTEQLEVNFDIHMILAKK